MSTASQFVSQPSSTLSPTQWLKKNLFSTWYNALLTFAAGAFVLFALYHVLTWVFVHANWAPVTSSFKLFAVGQYPTDQIWRVGAILLTVAFLMGVSWGVWGGTIRTFALALAVGFGLVALLPVGLDRMDLLLRAGFAAYPTLTVLGYLLGRLPAINGRWVLIGWLLSFILTIILLGGFPDVDAAMPLCTILLMVSFLIGASRVVWGGTTRAFALVQVIWLGLVALVTVGLNRMDLLLLRVCLLPLAFVLAALGYLLGRSQRIAIRWVVLLGWFLCFVLTFFLLGNLLGATMLPPVETGLWGGVLLTFLLALVGIVASFPIGVLLALGRQSSLPVLKIFCTLFIELVRGVPLVTILFMASIILPLFLPENVRIDRVLRAMIGMTLFAAAYMAENVRGGLQAIPKGQVEAAKAVGLNNFQTMGLIVLPQALRLVIPAIVGQFIALFMDTTLAIIVGLTELLAVGKAVLNSNRAWLLLDTEVYIFIAVVFWVFTYSMSYASRRLEAALGVGKR